MNHYRMPAKTIVFIHLLNNFSGSPKVLAMLIRGLLPKKYSLRVITSKGPGFLDGFPWVRYIRNGYQFRSSKFLTLFYWIRTQIWTFFLVLGMPRRNTVYYVNTIMPIGAVWACFLSRKRMIYHIHENMQQRKTLYGICRLTYRICNRESVFVSHYLESTAIRCRKGKVIYNALDAEFCNQAAAFLKNNPKPSRQTILMVASLKRYKGVYEFIEIARRMPEFPFVLVVSASTSEVDAFIRETHPSNNIRIWPLQTNLHPFYQKACLVLQLSHPNHWIETFGLTILEAMTYGIPVIGPNAGGPLELIENGVTGFCVDPLNLNMIVAHIQKLMTDPETYQAYVAAAVAAAHKFNINMMVKQINSLLN